MKKVITLLLCTVLLMALAACGDGLSDSRIRSDFTESGFYRSDSLSLDSFEIKEKAKDGDEITVTVTAEVSNYFAEAKIACDMHYTKEEGVYTLSECTENTEYETSFVLTAETLSNDDISILTVGYTDYASSNGSAVYPYMFISPNTSSQSGYDNAAKSGDITISSFRSDLENLTAYATVDMNKSSDYFTVSQTADFVYYFDTNALAWRVQSADVTRSSVKANGSIDLTTTALIGGETYSINYTGVNADGTLTGRVNGSDLSSSSFASSRVYGPSMIVRPHGKSQTWYYLIAEGNLASMYTKTGDIVVSPEMSSGASED